MDGCRVIATARWGVQDHQSAILAVKEQFVSWRQQNETPQNVLIKSCKTSAVSMTDWMLKLNFASGVVQQTFKTFLKTCTCGRILYFFCCRLYDWRTNRLDHFYLAHTHHTLHGYVCMYDSSSSSMQDEYLYAGTAVLVIKEKKEKRIQAFWLQVVTDRCGNISTTV